MHDFLQGLLFAGPLDAIGRSVLMFLLYLLAGLLPICGILYVWYFLLTLPMRRNERARMFIDVLALGIDQGHAPEVTIKDISASRDRALGVRFHLLAAHLEGGLRLAEALERVPRLLPPQIVAMLKTGERIGDIRKVLPACRQLLNDGVSHVRGALNYVLVLAFLVTPLNLVVPLVLRVKVLPKFRQVFEDLMGGGPLPEFTRLVFASGNLLTGLQLALILFLVVILFGYIQGPPWRWTRLLMPTSVVSWISWRLPWRRKRLQRDFSAMLTILLDSGVPEAEAVKMAGESTANRLVIRRAARVSGLLQQGGKLPEALKAMDDTGELHWRISNAVQREGGFFRALKGWHEALDAKAFQSEQSAAQLTTTFLVLFNGAIVACVVIGVFAALIDVINAGLLW